MFNMILVATVLFLTIVMIITPIIALLFYLITKGSFLKAWATSSIVIIGLILFITIPALLANNYEDKSFLKELDTKYEKMKDELPEDSSIEKLLINIQQTGSYRSRGKRGGSNLNIVAVIKNYNDDDFKGKVTFYAYHYGEKIGENEYEFEIDAHEEGSDFFHPSKINVDKEIWNEVEFEYTIEGEVK